MFSSPMGFEAFCPGWLRTIASYKRYNTTYKLHLRCWLYCGYQWGAGLHLAQHSGVYTSVVGMYALLYVIVHIVMAINRSSKKYIQA